MSEAGLRDEDGWVVLVTGPSGAGKDSVLAAAKGMLGEQARFVFPRRVVTRAVNADEDHATMSDAAFADARAHGAFALDWKAHGLNYGIPASIIDDVARGRSVVCNVSRGVVAAARARFAHVLHVEITAPQDILHARLLARGRESGSDVEARLERQHAYEHGACANVSIANDGPLDDAVARFVEVLKALG